MKNVKTQRITHSNAIFEYQIQFIYLFQDTPSKKQVATVTLVLKFMAHPKHDSNGDEKSTNFNALNIVEI